MNQLHDHRPSGLIARLKGFLPFGDGKRHDDTKAADRSLLAIAWFAFLLGFAHEEEFEERRAKLRTEE